MPFAFISRLKKANRYCRTMDGSTSGKQFLILFSAADTANNMARLIGQGIKGGDFRSIAKEILPDP